MLNTTPEIKERLAKRLEVIKSSAKNVNGYYVLEEKESGRISVFCSGYKYEVLHDSLEAKRAQFAACSTYYKDDPNTKQYGYCVTIKATAKKSVKKLNDFLAAMEFISDIKGAW